MTNFEKARLAKGFSQKEIAITLGVSQPTVSEWENGKKVPNGKNIKRLTEYLGVSSDYLLGLASDTVPPSENRSEVSEEIAFRQLTESVGLSQEAQEHLRETLELLKIRDMNERNSEIADEFSFNKD